MTMLRPLPVVLDPVDGQDLDSYLATTATANHLTGRTLWHRIANDSGVRFANGRATPNGNAPNPAILETIGALTMQPLGCIQSMTLLRYAPDQRDGPGTLLPWRPTTGVAICPHCIVNTPTIRPLEWRIPHLSICSVHDLILQRTCPHCRKPFRRNQTPAIPDTLTHCDNHFSLGEDTRCDYPLADLPAEHATSEQVAAARQILAATEGKPAVLTGQQADPVDYLDNLFAVTLLLTHLAAASADPNREWSDAIITETSRRTKAKKRLSAALPSDVHARTALLTRAAQILSCTEIDQAAYTLTRHLTAIPDSPAGPLAWLASHTRLTPFMSRIIIKAIAPKRTVSYQIGSLLPPISIPPQAIPQSLDQERYEKYFADAFDVLDTTGRTYVSLCCARRLPGVTGWAAAGAAIGIEERIAQRIPMNVSPNMRICIQDLLERLTAVECDLDPAVDYRQRETVVLRLFRDRRRWWPAWRAAHHPRCSRDSGFLNACEWMWQTHAGGQPFTQHWSAGWDRQRRARYRKWSDQLWGSPQNPMLPEASSKSGCSARTLKC